MNRSRSPRLAAGFITLAMCTLVLIVVRSAPQVADDPPKARDKPVALPANLAGVEITLGLKDAEPGDWSGVISVSAGKILEVNIVQGAKGKVDGSKFSVRSAAAPKKDKQKKKKKDVLTHPILRVTLDAPAEARLRVNTNKGNFDFVLADLPVATSKTFLDGQARVLREEGALRLTTPDTEDDDPAIARAPDGKLWLAYLEYTKSKGYVTERVLTGNFDELVPTGHGDRIRLKHFDGKEWSSPIDVTDSGLSLWRPAVAVDKAGLVHVFWSEQEKDRWEIYGRWYDPAAKKWGTKSRHSSPAGPDFHGTAFHVVAAASPDGDVWLAWQSWATKAAAFVIEGARTRVVRGVIQSDQPFVFHSVRHAEGKKVRVANSWSPAMAVDSKGNVYVACDTYNKGNYDVHLLVRNKKGNVDAQMIKVAGSPRFEARPSIAVDNKDRVWIAYEESDEQWGMDYSTNMFRKIGFEENPGYALYINRTVKVKCLVSWNPRTICRKRWPRRCRTIAACRAWPPTPRGESGWRSGIIRCRWALAKTGTVTPCATTARIGQRRDG
jgi:hypothetical protein